MSQPAEHEALWVGGGLLEPVLPAPRHELVYASPRRKNLAAWIPIWIVLLSLSAFTASLLVVFSHARQGFFVPALAIAICLLAALFDARTARIPNALTYPTILLGVALAAITAACNHWNLGHFASTAAKWLASPTLVQSLIGFAVCAAVGLMGSLAAKVGGGDIKLLAALGALLGLSEMGNVAIFALTIALLYALINLALAGRLNAACRSVAIHLLELVYLGRMVTMDHADPTPSRSMVPMAIPLVIGLAISQVVSVQSLLGNV